MLQHVHRYDGQNGTKPPKKYITRFCWKNF